MQVPVLIVGGGPLGLTASLELSRHGIEPLLVERQPSTTWHPMARNLNTRTMEIARGWGARLHDGLVALNLPDAWRSQVIYTRTLAGEELGRMQTAGFYGPGPEVSPEVPLLSSQDVFEPLLREAAETAGPATLRFGHELVDLERGGRPTDDEAVAVIEDRAGGRRYAVACQYLLAADGAASRLRQRLGIGLVGARDLAHYVNVYFRADLSGWTDHRPALLYWVAGPKTAGVFQPLDARGRWLCQIPYDGRPEMFATYDSSRCVEWIRTASGDAEVDPEILSVERWGLNSALAERLVSGRVILVGDAAHRIPPFGGFGLNTGIQAAHNLVWKLAHVLRGQADAALLATYEQERLAVASTNAERSMDNARLVQQINAAAAAAGPGGFRPAQAVAASGRYGNFLGMELGFTYEGAAVIPDGTKAADVDDDVTDYAPSAHPGRRAPHVWLERDGRRISILDLFGPGWAVVAAPGGTAWVQAVRTVAAAAGIEAGCYLVGTGPDCWTPVGSQFADQYELGETGAALIRPDGHVAFRSSEATDAAGATAMLHAALSAVLRPATSSI